jgi:hypothetical protein
MEYRQIKFILGKIRDNKARVMIADGTWYEGTLTHIRLSQSNGVLEIKASDEPGPSFIDPGAVIGIWQSKKEK